MNLFTADVHAVHTSDERSQLEAFLDTYRRLVNESLDGITEEEARRRLVPSRTTLLGLVKHATYVEQVWFVEAVTGTRRQQLGLPASPDDSFLLADDDTVASIREAHRRVCAASVETASHLTLDDVVTGHRFGPLSLRWIYLHLLRELAQHAGHADILREQLLAARTSAGGALEEPVVEE
ncbi:hypothetical protein N865_05045 [Intrasporangium oryzae NRRL B-24470]|uniref:Mini-circle protein n=1 Tax=Intrasporangium oryzae NRRL B-24470 TaxID=1386089 RepID=W9G8T3_9MICO|nr:DinB family protein [Intrasporangium oryzae]EWT02460.1 hypothetical protein N865_05045 [Intrasporangium oryzae NRRL B-24470]